ncbi:Crp/Fnr family transcriptional regulator [Anaerotignum faecicola]|nr:Crp/Fnr family transcriptional regulator [Anaerotignum faecicola]
MGFGDCGLFNEITPEEYKQMMECFGSIKKTFKSGEIICDYSVNSSQVGIIESGLALMVRIDFEGNRSILETLESGSIFGEEIAFSGSSKDSIFVLCQKNCTVLFLDYEHITKRCQNACNHHTLLVQNLFKMIADKLLLMSSRVEVLSQRTIRGKLLCYFNITAANRKSSSFTLPFSVTALADYICTDRSAMMREIKNLKEEGVIEMERRNVKLLQR